MTKRANGDYKEGFNLLEGASSDSETQEHFALPPLNLRGGQKSVVKVKSK